MRPINEQRRSELTDAAIDIVVRSRDALLEAADKPDRQALIESFSGALETR